MERFYVHGYNSEERQRLADQASTLADILQIDIRYPAGSTVLEAGCGVGAQTVTLARRSPEAAFVSVDVDAGFLAAAERAIQAAALTNVRFERADIRALPFEDGSFDHIFVCFVLEHLADVEKALAALLRLLKPGGTITVIEGDHGSVFFHPDSQAARETIQTQVTLQMRGSGDALLGRRLHPLMVEAGLQDVRVAPCVVYTDESRPALAENFTLKTFTAMVAGMRWAAIDAGLIDEETFDTGIRDLRRTAQPGGTFSYIFFKGIGIKPPLTG